MTETLKIKEVVTKKAGEVPSFNALVDGDYVVIMRGTEQVGRFSAAAFADAVSAGYLETLNSLLGDMEGLDFATLVQNAITAATDAEEAAAAAEAASPNKYQVAFWGTQPVVDSSAGKVRYPRMVVMRNGQSYKNLNPASETGGVTVNGGSWFELTYESGGTATYHYIDVSLIGSGTNPVKEVTGANVPDITNVNIVPLGISLNGMYFCFWCRDFVRYGQGSATAEVGMSVRPVFDPYNALGNGAAVYLPLTNVFIRARDMNAFNTASIGVTISNADVGGNMAGFCKLALPSTGAQGTLSYVVYDIDNTQFKIVSYPNVPGNPGGGAVGYRYVLLAFIVGAWDIFSVCGVDWLKQGKPLRSLFAFRGPLVLDASTLLIPPFYNVGLEDNVFSGLRSPTDGSAYWEQAVSTANGTPRRHYLDTGVLDNGGTIESALKTVDNNSAPLADGLKQHVFATSINGSVAGLGHKLANVVQNQCPYGKGASSDSMPLLSGATYGDITDTALTALGFTRGFVSSSASPAGKNFYAGMNFPDTRLGGSAFFRMYIQTDTAGNFGAAQQVYFWNGGSVITSMTLSLEKKLSTTAAIYSAKLSIPTTWSGLTHFFMGVSGSAGVTLRICGFQFHHSGQEADWIKRNDYPTVLPDGLRISALESATTIPTGTDLKPLIGDELFLVSDRAIPLFPLNLFGYRADANVGFAHVESDLVPPAVLPPAMESAREPILLSAADYTSSAKLSVRPVGTMSARYTKSLTVTKKTVPVAGSPAPKILCMGDSITRRGTPYWINQLLISWGFNPTFLGTLESENATGSYSGPLAEGREGWRVTDYLMTHTEPDDVLTAVLTDGGEATYLAASSSTRQATNPFMNVAASSSSAAPTITYSGVDYKFDLVHYQSRFSMATPDIVVLNLGKNDQVKDAASSLASVTTGYDQIIAEIRRAWPSAKIICWATTMPFNGGSNWLTYWYPILKAIYGIIKTRRAAGDANLHLCSTWAHQSPESFALNSGSVDSATGLTITTYSDEIHPTGISRYQHDTALAAAIACVA